MAAGAFVRAAPNGQPKKFAILAEGPLEGTRHLQAEIEQLTAEITARSSAAR